jgi:hypothetical protein
MLVSEGSDARRDVRGNMFLVSTCSTGGILPSQPQPYGEEPEEFEADNPPPLPEGSALTGAQEIEEAFSKAPLE